MSHPFGDLLSQYLHRKHGLSQARLAAGIDQSPTVVNDMCQGRRLSGPLSRDRVLDMLTWLQRQQVLATAPDANALLLAARMSPLDPGVPDEAALLQRLTPAPASSPPPVRLPSGTVTFLFTDVEGSTTRWEHQPQAMAAAHARHHEFLAVAIAAQHGYRFQIVGDAVCAAFATAEQGLNAAISAQQAMQHESWNEAGPIKVRMVLHTGVAEEHGQDVIEGAYSGPIFNRVARLLATAHGGQILLSEATTALVRDRLPEGVTLRSMGLHPLKDLLRPEQIAQVAVPGLPTDFPPLKTPAAVRTNLPSARTSFIGRDQELNELQWLLVRSRLVTVTGAGGSGKTRIAYQVAGERLAEYADGVWVVELAALSDPRVVPDQLCHVLHIQVLHGRTPLDALLAYLEQKQMLLVIDNCEHLLAACAEIADTILEHCPRVNILATSREALQVAGEVRWPIPTMRVPEPQLPAFVEHLSDYEAVQLFCARATEVQPDFTLNAANAAAVGEICRRLDGIPLALELAAAWVATLQPAQLARRLDDRFRLLVGGKRGALARQQTLRASIEWSYVLLSEPERIVLRRLAVFAGGCTLEAAEALCAGKGVEPVEVLFLLDRLVRQSLVSVTTSGAATRYGMLETIRQFAGEQLQAAEEQEILREQHLAYFAEMLEGKFLDTLNDDAHAITVFEQIEAEHENLQAAFEYALEHGAYETAAWMAHELHPFFSYRGYFAEARRWFTAVMEVRQQVTPTAQAWALYGYTDCVRAFSGYGAISLENYAEGLEIGRQVGDKVMQILYLGWLSLFSYHSGEYERSKGYLEEGLVLAQELGKPALVIFIQNLFGIFALMQHDLASAQAYFEPNLVLARQIGTYRFTASTLAALSEIAELQGDLKRATILVEEALDLVRQAGDQADGIGHLLHLACLAIQQEQYDRAIDLIAESREYNTFCGELAGFTLDQRWWLVTAEIRMGKLKQAHDHLVEFLDLVAAGSLTYTILALLGWTEIALAEQEYERAACLLGIIDQLFSREGKSWLDFYLYDRKRYTNVLEATRAHLAEVDFALAWSEGQAMDGAQVKRYILAGG